MSKKEKVVSDNPNYPPERIKGLKPIEKGEVRNPKGYPKGQPNSSTIINKVLDTVMKHLNPLTGENEESTVKEHMIRSIAFKAFDGMDVKSAEFLLERTDGKVTDKIEHSGEIDTGVTINIRKDLLPKDLDDLE